MLKKNFLQDRLIVVSTTLEIMKLNLWNCRSTQSSAWTRSSPMPSRRLPVCIFKIFLFSYKLKRNSTETLTLFKFGKITMQFRMLPMGIVLLLCFPWNTNQPRHFDSTFDSISSHLAAAEGFHISSHLAWNSNLPVKISTILHYFNN